MWDATTPAPGGLARQPTPAPPQSGTAPTMPAQLAMTPHALAETVASGAQSVVGPAPKSPLPWIVGGIGALIAGGVVFFLLRGGHRDAPPPPPRPQAIVQPAAAPPPVVTTPHPAVAPIDAAPAQPATVIPADATVAPPPPPKKPKHGATAPPTGTHDSHSIEDPFH